MIDESSHWFLNFLYDLTPHFLKSEVFCERGRILSKHFICISGDNRIQVNEVTYCTGQYKYLFRKVEMYKIKIIKNLLFIGIFR
jgi:hypothetical protein